jgi:flagellar protein FliS
MSYQNTARDNYILAEVQTATPQKLQLMLVEAAIKNVHRTKKSFAEQKIDTGLETLMKAQDIISAILSNLDKEGNPSIARQLASIYLFIFRRLAEAGMTYKQENLDDALRVLNSERETWKQVCEKFGSTVGQGNTGKTVSPQVGNSAEFISKTSTAQTTTAPINSAEGSVPKSHILVSPSATAAVNIAAPNTAAIPKSSGAFSRPGGFVSGLSTAGSGAAAGTSAVKSGIQISTSLAAPKVPVSAATSAKPRTGNSWEV